VTRDVKQAFIHACKQVVNMLQEYEGQLNYATDVWTSPNHKAFVAFRVHFAHEGTPVLIRDWQGFRNPHGLAGTGRGREIHTSEKPVPATRVLRVHRRIIIQKNGLKE